MATIKIIKSKGAYTFACNLTTGVEETPVSLVGWDISLALLKGSVNGESVWSTTTPSIVGSSFTATIPVETVTALEIGPYILSVFISNADSTTNLDQAIPVKVITRM